MAVYPDPASFVRNPKMKDVMVMKQEKLEMNDLGIV